MYYDDLTWAHKLNINLYLGTTRLWLISTGLWCWSRTTRNLNWATRIVRTIYLKGNNEVQTHQYIQNLFNFDKTPCHWVLRRLFSVPLRSEVPNSFPPGVPDPDGGTCHGARPDGYGQHGSCAPCCHALGHGERGTSSNIANLKKEDVDDLAQQCEGVFQTHNGLVEC